MLVREGDVYGGDAFVVCLSTERKERASMTKEKDFKFGGLL